MTTTTTTTATTAKDAFLRFAMRLDAVVSGAMGVAGVAMAPRIAELSGTTPALEYAVGVLFLGYGAAVYGLSRRRYLRTPGIVVVIANVGYAVGSLALVLAGVWPLTMAGIAVTLGSAVCTLVLADLQYVGLRRLQS